MNRLAETTDGVRAMRLRRRSGAVPAEPCFTVSGLRPPAAIARREGQFVFDEQGHRYIVDEAWAAANGLAWNDPTLRCDPRPSLSQGMGS